MSFKSLHQWVCCPETGDIIISFSDADYDTAYENFVHHFNLFDLLEAESEIVAGFHTEYSGMAFGWFYVGEFLHVWTVGALFGTFFLGGWRGPGADLYPILGILYFYLKTFLGYFLITWIRLSVPRIRIDHLLAFNWKFLTPLALLVLVVTAILDKLLANAGIGLEPGNRMWLYALIMLAANGLVGWITSLVVKRFEEKHQRERQTFPTRPVAVAPKPSDTGS